jgi:hypothetical protein
MASSSILKRSVWKLRREVFRLSTYSASRSSTVAPQQQVLHKLQRLYFSALPTQSDTDSVHPIVLPPPSALISKEDETHEETKRIRLSEVSAGLSNIFRFGQNGKTDNAKCSTLFFALGAYIGSS